MAIVEKKPVLISFLRNETLFNSREEAIEALKKTGKLKSQDGIPILARYKEGGSVKTLLGILYSNGETKSITVFGSSETISCDEKEEDNVCYNDVYTLFYDLNEMSNKLGNGEEYSN